MALASPGSAWNEDFALVWNCGVKGQSLLMSFIEFPRLGTYGGYRVLHILAERLRVAEHYQCQELTHQGVEKKKLKSWSEAVRINWMTCDA